VPDKYPEPKRNEPDGMEGSHAADRPKEPAAATKAATVKTAHDKDCKGCPVCDKDKKKESAVKTAHSKDCKGCDECEPKDKKKAAVPVKKADAEADKKEKDKKDEKKEAAVAPKKAAPKKAEADKTDADKKKDDAKDKKEASTPVTIALAAAKAAITAAKLAVTKAAAAKKQAAVSKKAEGEDDKPADDAPDDKGDDAPAEDAPEGDAPVDDGAPDDMPEGDEPPVGDAPEDEVEPFDEEHADLTDAVEDIKADIETLEAAIADFSGSPDDLALPPAEGDMPLPEEGMDPGMPVEGMEGDPLAPEGGEEELNLEDIFNQDAMADKVSSLNDEEEMMQAGLLGDDFFGPSEPSDLEAILEQEEGLTSPADMFALDGADNDPLAAMFASVKEASSDGDVVAPGDLQSYFDTDLKSDVRDADNDHTGDIASDVLESLKQPTRVETRDTAAKLQPPPKSAVIRRIKQAAPTTKVAAQGNLAKLLFTDDPDTF